MKRIKRMIFFIVIGIVLNVVIPGLEVKGATKQYGIMTADSQGNYSFYDLNSVNSQAGIEITDSGSIMVPLKKLCSLMQDLNFKYDFKAKKAAVTNLVNGKKVVFTEDSKYCYYYSSDKAKGIKKIMPYKMYVSNVSSASMVHMSALKWVLGTTEGVKYYEAAKIQGGGYDTSLYSGVILYNPSFAAILPKATNVKNISNTIKVTIPEGYSVSQIFDLLVKKGVCASTDFLYEAMQNYDFSYYPLVSEIKSENRCFLLEGYLYPDTYEFYRLSKGSDVIGKFLSNLEVKITQEDRELAQKLGYSVDEILTIASMIEKEAGKKEFMPNVSSVISNRLNKGMKLQLDATIFYIERYVKPYIDGDKDRYNSYYNTYKCLELPSGPICNPGKEAIQAALNPPLTDYLFFHSDDKGEYYFSATLE